MKETETHKGFELRNYKNMVISFDKTDAGSQERSRYLGGMEAILIINGVIEVGETFKKKQISYEERKYWFFSCGPMVTHYRTQTYTELMLELFGEFIKTQEDEQKNTL